MGLFQRLLMNIVVVSVMQMISGYAVADIHKCKDKDGNIVYRDKACFNTSKQELDIVVSPIDPAAQERLKRLRSSTGSMYGDKQNRRVGENNTTVIQVEKKRKPSTRCQTYLNKIDDLKERLKSGYSRSQGDQIEQSIDRYSRLYDQRCEK